MIYIKLHTACVCVCVWNGLFFLSSFLSFLFLPFFLSFLPHFFSPPRLLPPLPPLLTCHTLPVYSWYNWRRRGEKNIWFAVGSLKFLTTRTASSRHSKNPVQSPLINSMSALKKCLIIFLTFKVKIRVDIGVLEGIALRAWSGVSPSFKWCKYDFSGWDPNGSRCKQLNSTDATLARSGVRHILTSAHPKWLSQ